VAPLAATSPPQSSFNIVAAWQRLELLLQHLAQRQLLQERDATEGQQQRGNF